MRKSVKNDLKISKPGYPICVSKRECNLFIKLTKPSMMSFKPFIEMTALSEPITFPGETYEVAFRSEGSTSAIALFDELTRSALTDSEKVKYNWSRLKSRENETKEGEDMSGI